LRFYKIREKGVCDTDPAIYVQEASWFFTGANAVIYALKEKRPLGEMISKLREETKGIPLRHPKPLHSILIALFGLFTGGVKDWTGNLCSAFFGLLCIIASFLLIKKFYSMKVALFSSFILSVSPLHLLYSREAFAELDTLFFLIVALYLYLVSKDKESLTFLSLCGFFLGLSFLCNYRAFVHILLFFIYEVFSQLFTKKISFKRIFGMVIPILFLICCIELPYHIAFLFFKRAEQILPFSTYWEILSRELLSHAELASGFNSYKEIFIYPLYLLVLEGIFFIFAIAGALSLLKKERLSSTRSFLSFWFLAFIFFLILKKIPETTIRACSALSFPVAVNAAYFLSTISGKRKQFLFFLFPLLLNIYHSFHILQIKSGIRGATAYILETGRTKKHLTTTGWLSNLYMGYKNVEVLHYKYKISDLKTFYKKGYNYLLVDVHKYFMVPKILKKGVFDPMLREKRPSLPNEVLQQIEKKSSPVYKADDTRGLYPYYWFEKGGDFLRTARFWWMLAKEEKQGVKIYKLERFFEE
jgi:hypothetical protein